MRRRIAALAGALALLLGAQAWAAPEVEIVHMEAAPAPLESRVAHLSAAREAQQIVLVEYTGGTEAIVSRHECVGGLWTQLDSTVGYVGRTGMGKERAGDNKTPLGTYNLTTPFGILDDPGSILPYVKVTEYHYWCSTSGSQYYNQLVDARETGRRGSGPDEILIDYDGFYNYCMFIDYNAEGTPGRGACIFLHCTGGRDWTHGCIAVPEEYMKGVIRWAREGTKIVILDHPLTAEEIARAEELEQIASGTVVSTADVNVRSGPGLDFDALGVLSRGESATYLGRCESDGRGVLWYCVDFRGAEGWVSEKYAELDG